MNAIEINDQTRASLLQRLKNWQDEPGWAEFFKIYWKFIYGVSRRAGLTDAESQEVVQETLISVAKHMPTFQYDPAIGSFKAWLLTLTRWRIQDQFRKRQPAAAPFPLRPDAETRTDVIDALPDPRSDDQAAAWEAEWQASLVAAAMDKLKRQMDPQKWQIFDFYVNKGWPPEKVAGRFQVSLDQVYQIKHRLTEALRQEVRRLEKEVT
jgi:RNA polymerase sigma-70 factor (ECF subfamily)